MSTSTTSDSGGYGLVPWGSGPYGSPTDTGDGGTGQQPYGGDPHALPGRIQAQDFDHGGEGVAYHDTTDANRYGTTYRDTAVDLRRTNDGGSERDEYNVGYFEAGEWLEYTIAPDPGVYTVRLRVTTPRDGRRLRLSLDGTELATVDIPTTGGWDAWTTVAVRDISIDPVGETAVLRVACLDSGVDLNWLDFERTGDLSGETPAGEHSIVTLAAGEEMIIGTVYGTPPDGVSVDVAAGVSDAAAFSLGPVPQCAGATADGDRCSRDADVVAGELTCYQHDASDIPDSGW